MENLTSVSLVCRSRDRLSDRVRVVDGRHGDRELFKGEGDVDVVCRYSACLGR